MTSIPSTDDARVNNNPPQRPKLPGDDPMRVQYRVLSDTEKASMGDIKLAFEDLCAERNTLRPYKEPAMSDAVSAIKDFLHAVDRGYLGQMPSGFNDSAFVKALRDEVAKKHVHRYGTPYQTEVGYARNCQMSVSSDEQKGLMEQAERIVADAREKP